MAKAQEERDTQELNGKESACLQLGNIEYLLWQERINSCLSSLYEVLDQRPRGRKGLSSAAIVVIFTAIAGICTALAAICTAVAEVQRSELIDIHHIKTLTSSRPFKTEVEKCRCPEGPLTASSVNAQRGSLAVLSHPSEDPRNRDSSTAANALPENATRPVAYFKGPPDDPVKPFRPVCDSGADWSVARLSIAKNAGVPIQEQEAFLELRVPGGGLLKTKRFAWLDVCMECCEPKSFRLVKLYLFEDHELPAEAYLTLDVAHEFGHVSYTCKRLTG